MNILNQMKQIKNKYNTLKFNPKKTRKANENRFNKMRKLRLEFFNLQEKLDFTQFDISKLNLMAPCSGPWCLVNAENFELKTLFYFSFNFIGDSTKYVGEFSLLDDKCGINNLDLLIKQKV